MAEPSGRPLAVACVVVGDLHPDVDALSGRVVADPRALALSASDAAAVEHVLRLAEAEALSPLVVTAGPARVEPVLRELAALGAAVLRVAWPPVAGDQEQLLEELGADEAALARLVAAALAERGPVRLVVCGERSAARGTGAFPGFLAHELAAAQALGLVALEATPGGALRAERRLEGGRRELLEVPLPAVCSIEAAGVRLRRASLAGALAAAGAPVPVFEAAPASRRALHLRGVRPFVPRPRALPAPTGPVRERLLGLTGALSEREPPTVVGPVDAREAAGVLLAYLDRSGFPLPEGRRER